MPSPALLARVADELGRLVDQIERAEAEVGVPSAPARIDAARRRAVVLIDSVLADLGPKTETSPPRSR